ncbi:MAG TPA: hypothetical protein VJ750_08805 [Rhizomicrobium sp.]|nr:hypothetical protein [Rhizomicrobium sp.]
MDMRVLRIFALASFAVLAGTVPAWAFRMPDANAPYPTEHQRALRLAESQPQPFAMNYTDQAARTLGVKDGKWEAFETHSGDPLMPNLKGGIDGSGAMLRLQWRPGY